MKYIAFYLLVIAFIAFVVSATTGALANDLFSGCHGSYGAVIANEQGRC